MTKRNRDRISRSNESIELVQFVKVLCVVIIALLAVYFFTRIFVTKDLFNKKEDETKEETQEATIDYNVANMGMVFNRPYNEYYVMIYDFTKASANFYKMVVDSYKAESDVTKVYSVNLNSPFNSSYIAEESNPKAKSSDELKVKNGTLIKIKNGKIAKYIEDQEEISKELKVSK